MSAIVDAYNLLADPSNPLNLNPDYVFAHYIPDSMPDGAPKEKVSPLALVKNIQSNPKSFASNLSHVIENKIQIQIWFEYDDPLSDQYEGLLRSYLEDNNFQEYYSLVDKDPDLEKLFLTSKFIRTEFL